MTNNYNPTKWVEHRTVATANVMNNIEKGIVSAHEKLSEVDSQIKEKANESDLIVERQRIDSFTKLAEGSTTGDAELMDIRVTAEGETKDSAGDAVRSQFRNINKVIENMTEKIDVIEKTYKTEVSTGYSSFKGVLNLIKNKGSYIKKIILHTNGKSLTEYTLKITQKGTSTVLAQAVSTGIYSDGTYEAIEFIINKNIYEDDFYISVINDSATISAKKSTENNSDICISDDNFPTKTYDYGSWWGTDTSNGYYMQLDIIYEISIPKIIDKSVSLNKLGDDILNKISNDIKSNRIDFTLNLFNRVGACGDSFTQGSLANSSNEYVVPALYQPWFNKMAKRCGVDYANFGVGGSTTRSWLTNDKGLPSVLSSDPCDFYFLAWGINDANLGSDYIGSIDDINIDDYTQNADTFCGNYGKIISQIKLHSPNAKFVMLPVWYPEYFNSLYPGLNTTIKAIADKFVIPFINIWDDEFFSSTAYRNMKQSHPTPLGYTGMALAMERLLNKCIIENEEYFRFSCVG